MLSFQRLQKYKLLLLTAEKQHLEPGWWGTTPWRHRGHPKLRKGKSRPYRHALPTPDFCRPITLGSEGRRLTGYAALLTQHKVLIAEPISPKHDALAAELAALAEAHREAQGNDVNSYMDLKYAFVPICHATGQDSCGNKGILWPPDLQQWLESKRWADQGFVRSYQPPRKDLPKKRDASSSAHWREDSSSWQCRWQAVKFPLKDVVTRSGAPENINSEQGSHFTAQVLKSLHKTSGITQQLLNPTTHNRQGKLKEWIRAWTMLCLKFEQKPVWRGQMPYQSLQCTEDRGQTREH